MGASDQQYIKSAATWVKSAAPQYIDGLYLQSVTRTSTGVFVLAMTGTLSMLEQVPTLTPGGSDPTADVQLVIPGGGPLFTSLEVHTFADGSAADVDFFFLLEKIRNADSGA